MTVLLGGVLRGSDADGVLAASIMALGIWSVAGWLLGTLAGWLIEDSVRTQLAVELETRTQPAVSTAPPVAG